ncbi:MAG: FecR domain-containing protein [Polyangiaceae bacterium]
MNQPEHEQRVAEALGALARDGIKDSAADEAASRLRLLARVATIPPPKSVDRKWWFAAPALAAAAALVVWWRVPSRLSYEVVGSNKADSYVSAPSDRPVIVHFSDETLVQVEAGSRLRIEDTTREGARVLLERGTAGVHVVHRPLAHWTFAAGPFDVLVTGTRFDLHWNPTSEVMDLQLREGSVEIRTPFATAPIALRGGQQFRADLHGRSMTTTELANGAPALPGVPASQPSEAAAVEPAPSAVAGVSNGGSSVGSLTPSPAPSAPASGKAWSKLIASGEFASLLEQANERGIPACLRSCSAGDLSALADAARYTGKTDLADQSLHALRTRFPRAAEGHAAAFLLGRLREGQGAPKEARSWYDTYSSESPSGAYAAEALAGKMRTVSKTDGRAAAEPLAREYLKRYPTGVHAGTAQGILASQ